MVVEGGVQVGFKILVADNPAAGDQEGVPVPEPFKSVVDPGQIYALFPASIGGAPGMATVMVLL